MGPCFMWLAIFFVEPIKYRGDNRLRHANMDSLYYFIAEDYGERY